MGVKLLDHQPDILKGHEYQGNFTEYDWFSFEVDREAYAYAGMCFSNDAPEAWLYWRIVKPSVVAWRDLRLNVVPEMQDRARRGGASRVIVMTADPRDKDFDRMVAFMRFTPMRLGVQEV